MKKLLKNILVITIIMLAITLVVSCKPASDDGGDSGSSDGGDSGDGGATGEDIEVKGLWKHNESGLVPRHRTYITVENTSILIKNGDEEELYSLGVIKFDNDVYNAGETEEEKDHGYAVVRFNSGKEVEDEMVDKFGIIRWNNLNTDPETSETKVDFAIAYKPFKLAYRDTVELAESELTKAEGYFPLLGKTFNGSIKN